MNHGIDTSFLISAELAEHPDCGATRARMAELVAAGDRFSLAPQVLAEFIHIATDGRRFGKPLTMNEALRVAEQWWTAREIDRVFPTGEGTKLFLEWLQQHGLGRKRLLDTLLAATYHRAGVISILTLNARDFTVFGCFHCLGPLVRSQP